MDKFEVDLLGILGYGMWGSIPEEIELRALRAYWLQRGPRPVRVLEIDPPLSPATVERLEKIENPYYLYRETEDDQR
jgi:hypothetical protein